jgi:hypothetical protein
MSKANQPDTTRRAFLGSVAAIVPAAAVPVSAAQLTGADSILAAIEAHKAAYAEMEAAHAARADAEAHYPQPFLSGVKWQARLDADPALAAAIERNSNAMDGEETAFLALLAAARSATPEGLLALARYACKLTCDQEGPAVEGATYAYRALAAIASLPVTGAELDEVEGDDV